LGERIALYIEHPVFRAGQKTKALPETNDEESGDRRQNPGWERLSPLIHTEERI
jgi:hypothetical protein